MITEACAVDHPSATSNSLFGWLTAGTASAWASCVDAVHSAGGAMLLQLWHQGAVDTGGADEGFVGDPDWVAKVSDDRIGDVRPFRRADIAFL